MKSLLILLIASVVSAGSISFGQAPTDKPKKKPPPQDGSTPQKPPKGPGEGKPATPPPQEPKPAPVPAPAPLPTPPVPVPTPVPVPVPVPTPEPKPKPRVTITVPVPGKLVPPPVARGPRVQYCGIERRHAPHDYRGRGGVLLHCPGKAGPPGPPRRP